MIGRSRPPSCVKLWALSALTTVRARLLICWWSCSASVALLGLVVTEFLSPMMVMELSMVIFIAAGLGSVGSSQSSASSGYAGVYMTGMRSDADGFAMYWGGAVVVEGVRFARSTRYLSNWWPILSVGFFIVIV